MSEHLPECDGANPRYSSVRYCICKALRQAEQRGYDRALGDDPVESDPLYLRGRNDGYDAAMNEVPAIAVYGERLRSEGHAAALDAARDAVAAAMTKRGGYHSASEFSAVVLAAIDGVQP